MPTTVTKTIGTGGDYTTIAAWFAACPADLVAADQVWRGELLNEAFTASGAPVVTFTGITTDATRYVELTTAAGASFVDNASVQSNALRYNAANGAAISVSGDFAQAAIRVTSNMKVALSKLQIQATGSSVARAFLADTGTVIIDRCIMESAAGDIPTAVIANATSSISNSLIVNRAASSSAVVLDTFFAVGLYNTVIAALGSAVANLIQSSYGTPVAKNCGFFGCTAISAQTITYTNCFTSVGSPPSGCTTTAFSTSTGAMFESITNGSHDFRIKSGSALQNAGADEPTYAAVSINGLSRTSGAYDVGPWEIVPVPPVITGPTGAAGAASITVTAAEHQAAVGTWSASNSGTWSLTGTDAALLAISAGGVVTKATGLFHFPTKSTYSFTVNATNAGGSSSQAVTLNITDFVDTTPPTLTGTLSVSAIGDGVATVDGPDGSDNDQIAGYEWALSLNGAGYVVYGNTTPSVVNLTGLTNGGTYIARQRAFDREGNFSTPALFSQAFIPGAAPTVTQQPSSLTVSAGSNASFTSTGTGAPAPVGQWQHLVGGFWTDLAGQTANTLLLNGVTLADNGRQFRRNYTNALGSVPSNSVTLTVTAATQAPTFTTQPVSVTVNVNGTMTLTAAAQGAPTPTLQWQRWNGTTWANILGATASSYSLSNVQLSDNGAQFRCVATNGVAPDATSNVAVLTVSGGGAGTYTATTQRIGVSGTPLANTPVFYSLLPGRAGAYGAAINKTGTTGADGSLVVSHTAPGDYWVLVSTRPGPAVGNDTLFAELVTLV